MSHAEVDERLKILRMVREKVSRLLDNEAELAGAGAAHPDHPHHDAGKQKKAGTGNEKEHEEGEHENSLARTLDNMLEKEMKAEASTPDLSQPRKQAALSTPKDDVAQHRGTLKSRALERDRRKAAAQAARAREREELLQKKREIEMLLRETGGGEEQGNANPTSEGALSVLSPSRDPLSRGNPFPLRKGIVPNATGEGPGTDAPVESNYEKNSPAAKGGVSSASTSGIWRPNSPSVKLGTAGQGQLRGDTAKDPRQISANPQVAAELERLARVQALILKRMHSEWDKEFELEKSVAPHFYVPARGDEARKNFDVKHNRPRSVKRHHGRGATRSRSRSSSPKHMNKPTAHTAAKRKKPAPAAASNSYSKEQSKRSYPASDQRHPDYSFDSSILGPYGARLADEENARRSSKSSRRSRSRSPPRNFVEENKKNITGKMKKQLQAKLAASLERGRDAAASAATSGAVPAFSSKHSSIPSEVGAAPSSVEGARSGAPTYAFQPEERPKFVFASSVPSAKVEKPPQPPVPVNLKSNYVLAAQVYVDPRSGERIEVAAEANKPIEQAKFAGISSSTTPFRRRRERDLTRPKQSDLLRGRASAARAVKIENFPHTLRRTSSSQAPTTEGSERSKRATDKFINRQRSPKRYKKPDPLARPWNTRAESSKLNEKEVQEVAQLRRRSELGAERLLRKVVRPRLLEHADQQLAEHVLEEEEERLSGPGSGRSRSATPKKRKSAYSYPRNLDEHRDQYFETKKRTSTSMVSASSSVLSSADQAIVRREGFSHVLVDDVGQKRSKDTDGRRGAPRRVEPQGGGPQSQASRSRSASVQKRRREYEERLKKQIESRKAAKTEKQYEEALKSVHDREALEQIQRRVLEKKFAEVFAQAKEGREQQGGEEEGAVDVVGNGFQESAEEQRRLASRKPSPPPKQPPRSPGDNHQDGRDAKQKQPSDVGGTTATGRGPSFGFASSAGFAAGNPILSHMADAFPSEQLELIGRALHYYEKANLDVAAGVTSAIEVPALELPHDPKSPPPARNDTAKDGEIAKASNAHATAPKVNVKIGRLPFGHGLFKPTIGSGVNSPNTRQRSGSPPLPSSPPFASGRSQAQLFFHEGVHHRAVVDSKQGQHYHGTQQLHGNNIDDEQEQGRFLFFTSSYPYIPNPGEVEEGGTALSATSLKGKAAPKSVTNPRVSFRGDHGPASACTTSAKPVLDGASSAASSHRHTERDEAQLLLRTVDQDHESIRISSIRSEHSSVNFMPDSDEEDEEDLATATRRLHQELWQELGADCGHHSDHDPLDKGLLSLPPDPLMRFHSQADVGFLETSPEQQEQMMSRSSSPAPQTSAPPTTIKAHHLQPRGQHESRGVVEQTGLFGSREAAGSCGDVLQMSAPPTDVKQQLDFAQSPTYLTHVGCAEVTRPNSSSSLSACRELRSDREEENAASSPTLHSPQRKAAHVGNQIKFRPPPPASSKLRYLPPGIGIKPPPLPQLPRQLPGDGGSGGSNLLDWSSASAGASPVVETTASSDVQRFHSLQISGTAAPTSAAASSSRSGPSASGRGPHLAQSASAKIFQPLQIVVHPPVASVSVGGGVAVSLSGNLSHQPVVSPLQLQQPGAAAGGRAIFARSLSAQPMQRAVSAQSLPNNAPDKSLTTRVSVATAASARSSMVGHVDEQERKPALSPGATYGLSKAYTVVKTEVERHH